MTAELSSTDRDLAVWALDKLLTWEWLTTPFRLRVKEALAWLDDQEVR